MKRSVKKILRFFVFFEALACFSSGFEIMLVCVLPEVIDLCVFAEESGLCSESTGFPFEVKVDEKRLLFLIVESLKRVKFL